MQTPSRRLLLLSAALLLALASCSSTQSERRYSKAQAAKSLSRLETVGLEIGEFTIDGDASVVDGDTIRVKGLKSSLRLIGIDTEEIPHKAEERQLLASETWENYLKKMKGNSDRPVKMATPLGWDATHYAQKFFTGVSKVKLERDHPGEIRDYYGRYLAYVLVERGGKWVNYNIECVRDGMAPYFTKYAYSRRFHKEFVEAQEQARAAKLGVWDPNRKHYPDYDERLKWWNERADVIAAFEKDMEEHDNYIALTRWDALRKLEARLGQEVVVLGSVADIRYGDKGPSVVKLARTRTSDFDVVFFDKDVLLSTGLKAFKGEFVRVKGVVRKYHDQYRNADKLQIAVTMAGQVITPSEQLDELLGLKGGRKIEAVPAEKGAIKPTGRPVASSDPRTGDIDLTKPDKPEKQDKPDKQARPAAGKKASSGSELPEVENRPVKDGAKGPLDLGDASQTGELQFDSKDGPLNLTDAEKAGALDFSSMGDSPDY